MRLWGHARADETGDGDAGPAGRAPYRASLAFFSAPSERAALAVAQSLGTRSVLTFANQYQTSIQVSNPRVEGSNPSRRAIQVESLECEVAPLVA